jgi:two-component system sensor histidine kinase/response regulator
MPALKRLRKTQEPVATTDNAAKRSAILGRVLEEVAAPLDETAALCQRLLDGSGGKLPLEQRELAEGIAEGTLQAAQRLRDYVDLLLLEAGELPLRPKVANLGDLIEQAAHQLRTAARAKGLSLVVEPAAAPLPPVLADPARVSQVLVNLIANAIKFTDRGQVIVSTEPYDRSVAVHVVDTGVGIQAVQQSRLFEDFFQGDGARLRDPKGCGLGLTLSRRLVTRVGGDLWASSTGAGSKFSFTVPRAPVAGASSRLSSV